MIKLKAILHQGKWGRYISLKESNYIIPRIRDEAFLDPYSFSGSVDQFPIERE